jgi:putative DNA primase/helicase
VRLSDAIAAAGMTPPTKIVPGRWLRFPGVGKGRSNRSGWCRVIAPTLAIFGDWSSGMETQVWRDDSHVDDERTRRVLLEAQRRERQFVAEERARQNRVAQEATVLVSNAKPSTHPYLARKGFPALTGLVSEGKLVVPMMDFENYPRIISAQLIDADGGKKFLPGGRAKRAVYRLGAPQVKARRVVLCEGYATGLSLDAALRKLTGPHSVLVCFSAGNLETVAAMIPKSCDALVAADHDASKTGEQAARRTGLRWVMPAELGDWNDVHTRAGIMKVVEALRCSSPT